MNSWISIPEYQNGLHEQTPFKVSFIIPARNEETNIRACLSSVLASCEEADQDFEVYVIDDHSEDETANLVTEYNDHRIKLIKLEDELNQKVNAYKKMALATGLKYASGDYIIQLDADVIIPINYMSTVRSAIDNTKADMIAAPVLLSGDNTMLSHFQILDLLGMMAVTGSGIYSNKWFMANGANLIYKNNLVQFTDDSIASGDDIYSIQKVAKKENKKIVFLKSRSAAVSTSVMPDYNKFYDQRIRWATKNKYMKGSYMRVMMLIPFLNNLILIAQIIFAFLYGPIVLVLAIFQFISKLGIDYVYLKSLADYYKKEDSLTYFIPANIMHIVYISSIGLLSLIKTKYTWKGRRVS